MCVMVQGGIFGTLFYRTGPYQLTGVACMKFNLGVTLIIKCV